MKRKIKQQENKCNPIGFEREAAKVNEHPFFGMIKASTSVEKKMDAIRGCRRRAVE